MHEIEQREFNKNDEKLELIEAKPHPIFSAIVDMYIVEMILGVISFLIGCFISIIHLEINYVVLIMWPLIIISMIAVIIYHATFSKKIMCLSPGEIIGGKSILDKEKVWINPYGINRFGLFFVCILTLLTFRNSGAIAGNITSIPMFIGFLLRIIMVISCIILIGKGRLRGIAIINTIVILSFGLNLLINNLQLGFYSYFTLGIFIIFTLVGIIYHNLRLPKIVK